MIFDLALYLVDDIESYLTDDLCAVESVGVIYGEPRAPEGENCRRIWVWVDRVEDADQFEQGCAVRSRLTLNYRIYSCFDADEEEDHNDAADCLYGLMTAVWCGLVASKDDKTLMLLGSCDQVTLNPLTVDSPQGGTVSATGSVTVDFDCPPLSA